MPSLAETVSGGMRLVPAGDGRMWLDRDFRIALAQAGLNGFDDVMTSSRGRCLRVLEDRENWYLRLEAARGRAAGMYLKKHHVRTWATRVRARLGGSAGPSPGSVEAENVRALESVGIDVMRLVAYGERLRTDGRLESFLLTEELEGYCELQEFIRRRFAPTAGRSRHDPDLDRLIEQVAVMARRFHAAGYNHRDFYCCHFLTKELSPGVFDVRLIDLQRVERRRYFRRRWIVKDLAQLAYSAPRDRLGCRHLVIFLRHYLGVRKLRPGDKRLVRAVVRKQLAMERRLGRAP
jgi:heptose I phosphotransferase